jgi:outer membrane biosynthesis protein TonB
MTEDLKRQASELYRKRAGTDELPSASLSMKRLIYIAVALVLVALLAIEVTFRFTRRQQPTAASTAAPQTQPIQPPAPAQPIDQAPTPQPHSEPAAQPAQPPVEASEPRKSEPAEAVQPPVRKAEKPRPTGAPSVPESSPAPEQKSPVDAAPSPEATARLELVRSILMERFPSLASDLRGSLVVEQQDSDVFQATLTRVDDATGSPAQYVWRVNSTTRSVTPLSFYARKLP